MAKPILPDWLELAETNPIPLTMRGHRFFTARAKDPNDDRIYEWCDHCGKVIDSTPA